MTTDNSQYPGGLLSQHSRDVLAGRRVLPSEDIQQAKLQDLAQRLKDAQDEQTARLTGIAPIRRPPPGPVAQPTGTSGPLPPAGPMEPSVFRPAGPGETQGTQLYQARQAPGPSLSSRIANAVNPPGTPLRAATDYLGSALENPVIGPGIPLRPAVDYLANIATAPMRPGYQSQDAAIQLQNAPDWQKVMMGMPVGAPAGSIAGSVPSLKTMGALGRTGLAGVAERAGPVGRDLATGEAGFTRLPGGGPNPAESALPGMDAQIANAQKALRTIRAKGDDAAIQAASEHLSNLVEGRRAMLEAELPPADVTRLHQLEEEVTGLQAELSVRSETGGQALIRPPRNAPMRLGFMSNDKLRQLAEQERLNPYQGEWWDSIDPKVVHEVQTSGMTRPTRTPAMIRQQIRLAQRDIDEITAGHTMPVTPGMVGKNMVQQGGNIQAGMGIGEKAAQGTLFENLQGQAERIPLADQEQMALRQARTAEIARGQAEMPITEPVAAQALSPAAKAAQATEGVMPKAPVGAEPSAVQERLGGQVAASRAEQAPTGATATAAGQGAPPSPGPAAPTAMGAVTEGGSGSALMDAIYPQMKDLPRTPARMKDVAQVLHVTPDEATRMFAERDATTAGVTSAAKVVEDAAIKGGDVQGGLKQAVEKQASDAGLPPPQTPAPIAGGLGGGDGGAPGALGKAMFESGSPADQIGALKQAESLRMGAQNKGSVFVQEANQLARAAGVKMGTGGQPFFPKPLSDALFLHLNGEGPVPPGFQRYVDFVKAFRDQTTSDALAADPTFQSRMISGEYFSRMLKPEAKVGQSPYGGASGVIPGFEKQRTYPSLAAALADGREMAHGNPAVIAARRDMAAVEDRMAKVLVDRLTSDGLALPAGEAPGNWRIPRVGPAFEGRGGAGTLLVPKEIANRLEDLYGKQPTLEIKGHDMLRPMMSFMNTLKQIKLTATPFEHIEFGGRRTGAATMEQMVRSLRTGNPAGAVKVAWSLPGQYAKLAAGQFSEQARIDAQKMFASNKPILMGADGKPVTMALGVQRGLSPLPDASLFAAKYQDMVKGVADAKETAGLGKATDALGGFTRWSRNGVMHQYRSFSGWYFSNVAVPGMKMAHPEWTAAKIAEEAGQATNKAASSLPSWQQALDQPAMRTLAHATLFSSNRLETGIRGMGSAFVGSDKRYWQDRLAGQLLFTAAVAELVHHAATGQWLPNDRFVPVSTRNGIGYNSDWLSPNTGMVGANGQPIKADVMGQAEVPYRILFNALNPANELGVFTSRENVPLSAASNQIAGKGFWGNQLNAPKVIGQGVLKRGMRTALNRGTQAASDLFAPISAESYGEAARQRFPATQPFIPQGEKALGVAGNVVQGATGLNLRAQSLKSIWAKDTAAYAAMPIAGKTPQERERNIHAREIYLRQNPDVDAKLFLTGQVGAPSTDAARQVVVRLMQQNRIGVGDIKGMEPKPDEARSRTVLRDYLRTAAGQVQPAATPAASGAGRTLRLPPGSATRLPPGTVMPRSALRATPTPVAGATP